MRESATQKKAMAYARALGWVCHKVHSESTRGFPDTIYFRDGIVFLIEFKSAKGVLSKCQEKVIQEIVGQRVPVTVCSSLADAVRVFDRLEEELHVRQK